MAPGMRILRGTLMKGFSAFASLLSFALLWNVHAAVQTGPATGQRIPSFSLPDQTGRTQSLDTIAGSKGAMLVFYRSADW
jgi:hypothetical protein